MLPLSDYRGRIHAKLHNIQSEMERRWSESDNDVREDGPSYVFAQNIDGFPNSERLTTSVQNYVRNERHFVRCSFVSIVVCGSGRLWPVSHCFELIPYWMTWFHLWQLLLQLRLKDRQQHPIRDGAMIRIGQWREGGRTLLRFFAQKHWRIPEFRAFDNSRSRIMSEMRGISCAAPLSLLWFVVRADFGWYGNCLELIPYRNIFLAVTTEIPAFKR